MLVGAAPFKPMGAIPEAARCSLDLKKAASERRLRACMGEFSIRADEKKVGEFRTSDSHRP